LLSWVVENNPSYKVITRAVRETDGIPDPKGKVVWDRFDAETLQDLERDLGPYMFSALYMNNPTSASNQVFRREWINYYNDLPLGLLYCTSVDPAASDMEASEDPDYNVVMTTGINPKNGHIYVVEYTRERMTPGELINEIFRHEAKYHPIEVIIEAISYQRTLCYWLEQKQNKLGRNFIVNQIKGLKGSKEDRVRGLQPFFANNRIFIKVSHDMLERELLAFPSGAHDDLPDALQLQLAFWGEVNAEHEVAEHQMNLALPNSGLSIINELRMRNQITSNYRFDMGNRKDIINPKFVRSYYGKIANG
jgi:predicted phage terminase large subunit-like protein